MYVTAPAAQDEMPRHSGADTFDSPNLQMSANEKVKVAQPTSANMLSVSITESARAAFERMTANKELHVSPIQPAHDASVLEESVSNSQPPHGTPVKEQVATVGPSGDHASKASATEKELTSGTPNDKKVITSDVDILASPLADASHSPKQPDGNEDELAAMSPHSLSNDSVEFGSPRCSPDADAADENEGTLSVSPPLENTLECMLSPPQCKGSVSPLLCNGSKTCIVG